VNQNGDNRQTKVSQEGEMSRKSRCWVHATVTLRTWTQLGDGVGGGTVRTSLNWTRLKPTACRSAAAWDPLAVAAAAAAARPSTASH